MESDKKNMIEIDASQGEGGGQILRSSLALSMCTGRAVALRNIRAKRPKPGLMRQHLTCVQAAAAVSSARVDGAELGSSTLVFEPGPVVSGDYRFSVGTAGSCTLVLQTVWPALMLRGQGVSRIELSGGTHNSMAPPYHFIERCYLPLLRRLGVQAEVSLRRHGFYPAGGGEVHATLEPLRAEGLQPVDVLSRGAPLDHHIECLAAAVPPSVAPRQFDVISRALGWPAAQMRTPAMRQNEGPGQVLMATLAHQEVTELFSSFGAKGLSAEAVALALVDEVRAYQASYAALGPHLTDQWTLPLALAVWQSGRPARFTSSELTEHARTNFDVIGRFLPVRFDVEEAGPSSWRVQVSAT